MKKTLIIIAIIISILSLNKHEQSIVPKESIRFRIIANSNNQEDQKLKKEILRNLKEEINTTNNIMNINDTRKYIINELPVFNRIVDKTIKENNKQTSFHINYGKNYFPEKVYNGKTYEEGEYESLVITIGEGVGDNFWCILFPPLCLINEDENIEYESFTKKIVAKFLKKE